MKIIWIPQNKLLQYKYIIKIIMKYQEQIQTALTRLDESLFRLRGLIKRGDNRAALTFIDEGQLKERFEELQNIVHISGTNPLGARGTTQIGTL